MNATQQAEELADDGWLAWGQPAALRRCLRTDDQQPARHPHDWRPDHLADAVSVLASMPAMVWSVTAAAAPPLDHEQGEDDN